MDIKDRLLASACSDTCLMATAAKEIASLREQLENMMVVVGRVERERNEALEDATILKKKLLDDWANLEVYGEKK